MKLVKQLAITLLLLFGVFLTVSAETAKAPAADTKAQSDKSVPSGEAKDESIASEDEEGESTPELAKPEGIQSFTVEHRIKETVLPKRTVEANPLMLLQTLKTDILAQLKERGKPLSISTTIAAVLTEDWAKNLGGDIPPIAVKTDVDDNGKGKSEFTLPALKRDIPANKETFNWKGFQGTLNFTDKFDNLAVAATMEGLSMASSSSALELGKISFAGELDADLLPLSIDLNMPLFKVSDKKDKFDMNIQGVVVSGKTKKLDSGLDLSEGNFKISQVTFNQASSKGELQNFELQGAGELQTDGVRYAVTTKIGKLALPDDALGEKMDLSYVSNLELRRLDAGAVAEIQKTARELQKQRQMNIISQEMLGIAILGKLMEVTPKLLAKSPELALTELNIKTPQGNLQGKLTVTVDGKKAATLNDFSQLTTAMQGQADFSITKTLLEKMMMVMLRGPEKMTADSQKQLKATSNEQIKDLVDKKYLVEAGDSYKLVAVFKAGQLTVNGQPIELPKSPEPTTDEETPAPKEEVDKK